MERLITLHNDSQLYHRRGAELLSSGHALKALPLLEKARALQPDKASLLGHLAATHSLLGQFAKADEYYQDALKRVSTATEIQLNAARNAGQWGRNKLVLHYVEPLLSQEETVASEAQRMRSDALRRLGRLDEALTACCAALETKPLDPQLLLGEATLAMRLKRPQQALAACEQLRALAPLPIMAVLVKAQASQALGDLAASLSVLETALERNSGNSELLSKLAFSYQYTFKSPSEQLAHARRFGVAVMNETLQYRHWHNTPEPGKSLKVGLLSGDLRQHPLGYFLRDLLVSLVGSSLRITVYDSLNLPDAETARIQPYVDQWRIVKPLDDLALAELVRRDHIDIIIDLSGHTNGHRLAMLARKPAPIQLSWAGFLATTGTPNVDYVLADRWCVPAGKEDEFSEKVWRLPNSYYCFSRPEFELPIVAPPVLRNGYITFGSCNNPDKFNDRVLRLWGKVLDAVPQSRLLLKSPQWSEPDYRQRVFTRMAAVGLDTHRVDTEGGAPRAELMASYNRMDITLDPFPYGGGTTSVEALWAGVPMLALKGDRMAWRMAESFLNVTGMEDWLAQDETHFVALAKSKAADIKGLINQRARQRGQVLASALFDTASFATDFEAALRGMWQQWCEDKAK